MHKSRDGRSTLGNICWALRLDFAEAAANILTREGHENNVYELFGKLMMQEELVSVLGDVFGKEIPVQQVDDDTYSNTNMMRVAGVPEAYIPM